VVGEEQRVERVERDELAERLDGDDTRSEPARDPRITRARRSTSTEQVLHVVHPMCVIF
jgi:hypothetical protein